MWRLAGWLESDWKAKRDQQYCLLTFATNPSEISFSRLLASKSLGWLVWLARSRELVSFYSLVLVARIRETKYVFESSMTFQAAGSHREKDLQESRDVRFGSSI